MTQQLTVAEMNAQPVTMSASNAIFNVQALTQLTSFANLMADSTVTVPAHFVGKPADCMAVVMQAMQWGMNPYAVAQKTYLVGGVLGYEAQLVNAVVTSSNVIQGRFHYEYGGDWSKCTKTKEATIKKSGKNGSYEVTQRVKAWSDDDEDGLYIRVGAVIRGEGKITWGEPVYLSGVAVRNSPLWATNPKQQIAYLAVKYWSRLYCPEVILGVYTPDEIEVRAEKEINPQPQQRASINQMSEADVSQPVVAEQSQVAAPTADTSKLEAEFMAKIEAADSCEKAKAIRVDLDEQKAVLGNSLFTALKGKAVAKYHQLDSHHAVEAALNSLDVSDPEAKQHFARAEQLLNSRKQKLGAELFDAFTITLNDLRPEFQ